MLKIGAAAGCLVAVIFTSGPASGEEDDHELVTVGAQFRARYERLGSPLRADAPSADEAVLLRTILIGRLELDPFRLTVEVMDARLFGHGVPRTTALVNPLDLLQAHMSASFAVSETLTLTGRVGRLTMNLGSRRLAARNRYRNTINSFTGLDVEANGELGTLKFFALLPVRRRPGTPEDLERNLPKADREGFDAVFAGAWFASSFAHDFVRVEGGLLVLRDRDTDDDPTADRDLVTLSLRAIRPKRAGAVDFDLEAALQAGRSRASSSPTDTRDLTHLAGFAHASVGYTGRAWWRPHARVLYDFASGDDDPEDGRNGRFDSLFGARRFDYGPTSLYGLLGRSNTHSPGARFEVAPYEWLAAFVGYRAVWLAAARDAWTTTGIRDPDGDSGTFVGHQAELRIRFRPLSDNVTLEVGGARLWPGAFVESAAPFETGAPTLLYAQIILDL